MFQVLADERNPTPTESIGTEVSADVESDGTLRSENSSKKLPLTGSSVFPSWVCVIRCDADRPRI